MSMPPWPMKAWVTSQDPDNYAVFVALGGSHGGQGPTLSVQVLTHGPRDGVAGYFPALPTAGTHGLVCFPSGDSRNGFWMGSMTTQSTDADAHAPGNGAADYAAHYGGGYSYRDQDGSLTEAMPDGTTIQVGPTLPALTRHTIDATQARRRTAFTAAQRRPQTPGPYPVTLNHPTGALASLSASGAWAVQAAPGQSITLSVSGGVVVTLDGSTGNLTIASAANINLTSSSAIALHAPQIAAGNGGTLQRVRLADNTVTTVFAAQ